MSWISINPAIPFAVLTLNFKADDFINKFDLDVMLLDYFSTERAAFLASQVPPLFYAVDSKDMLCFLFAFEDDWTGHDLVANAADQLLIEFFVD